MSDTIGRIAVPSVVNSGQTFPLTTQYPFGFSVERPVIVHRFGSLDAKQEQRYYTGIGPRKFTFKRPNLNWSESRQLKTFWESMQGPWQAFTYSVPNAVGSFTNVLVTFEQTPLSFDYLRTAAQLGFNLIEVVDPTAAPSYTVASTCTRFPSSTLSNALLAETQQIVPLVHIRVRESAVPDIYLSDRRVKVGGQLYLPRIAGMGEPGSDAIVSQDVKGSSDTVKLAFGNGDRVMTRLCNDTDLKYAEIDLCLFHVNSGILLQLWAGVIQNFTSDGSPTFPVTCSDGFFQIMNQYPERQISRQCWKTFNDGINCPYSTRGSGGSATSCDYYLESANGCQAHGMASTFSVGDGAIGTGSHSLSSSSAAFAARFVGLPIFIGKGSNILNTTIATFVDAHHVTTAAPWTAGSVTGATVSWGTAYFGAQQADPQGVTIKDDSTGFLGFGRNTVTATSIVSDTVWGLALPEIWCNSGGNALFAYLANALMVDYRDESGYADSLGILGAGPLGGFTASMVVTNADGFRYVVAPMVDGYLWQGLQVNGNLNVTKYQPGMGLRQITGNDPANPNYDFFSLGSGSPQVWEPNNYAAGTAACEIRIVKSTTIQPSTPDQHQMTVPIDYGMWGWTWDQNGNRTAVKGLINPFWIAVNMLLRALGLYGGPSTGSGPSSASQLAAFVLPSLIAGDGSGAAEIAAAQVTPILGTGTETQFQFQGVISSQKPFRDWLTEVLNCCLGYYTWEFGKLKLGCRINSSAVDAYSLGNTLFQTLKLTPIQAAFEHRVLSYADVAYQYQANTAEYCDKSHAAYYGRAGSPLTSQTHSVGCSTLSQALRIVATQTREELGGVTQTEWRDARAASWQTTLLGLGNEVGQVVSMTHPDIPGLHGTCNVSGETVTWAAGDAWQDSVYTNTGGATASALLEKDALINGVQVTITAVNLTGNSIASLTVSPAPGDGSGLSFQVITASFRLQRWSLKKDWSVQLEGQTVTASMYDLDVGPKPMDVAPSPLPALFTPIPLGPAWAPYQIQAPSWDALFPSEYNFDSNQQYTTLADGSVQTSLAITGKWPVNEFSATGAGAPVISMISQSPTGGSLPANSTLLVSLCAIDSSGLPSYPSDIAIIGTSGTGTDSFTLNGIVWPAVSGLASYVLFISTQDDLICAQASGPLTPGSGGTIYTPGTIIFNGPLQRSTWALPSPYVQKVRIKAKLGGHLGILGCSVNSVTTNTVNCGELIDTSSSPPNLVGRVLSVIGRESESTPLLSVTITAYDPIAGTVTVSPQAVVTGNDMQSIKANDVVIVRMIADSPNTSNQTQISDAGMINVENQWAGLIPGGEVGNVFRVIAGTGRGQTRKITGNTTTGFSWDLPLPLDETSIFITESPTWDYVSDSTTIDNADYKHQAILTVAATNFINRSIVVAGFTVDENGTESPDGDGPLREDWIYGSEGAGPVAGFTLQSDGTLAVQSDAAPAFYLNTPFVPGAVDVYLKTAPTGAALTITLNSGSTTWMTLTIPAGSTSVSATPAQIAAAGTIPANTNVSLSIMAVGTIFPGSDLSVFVYS